MAVAAWEAVRLAAARRVSGDAPSSPLPARLPSRPWAACRGCGELRGPARRRRRWSWPASAAFRETDTKVGFGGLAGDGVRGAVRGPCWARWSVSGSSAPPLPESAPLHQLGAERGWILLVILLVWSFDTGAYCVGIALGKRKFLSHISPSKSYWGLFGGLAACHGRGRGGSVGPGPAAGRWAWRSGRSIGLVAQAGDLAESMLKRAAGAKDSGGLIPGHGGILDRVDSFLFAAPVAAIFVTALVR